MPVFMSPKSSDFQPVLDWLHGQRQPTPELYMRGMTILELLWRQRVPGLSFQVVYDEPDQLPGKAAWIAMMMFEALQQDRSAQE
jgi:hypothetical protein